MLSTATSLTSTRAAAVAGFAVNRLEKHRPVMHPLSLRCVLQPAAVTTPPLHNLREGWDRVRQADRDAWRYHRRRWSLPRRLAHRWF